MLVNSAFYFTETVLDRDLQLLVKAWHPHHRGDNLAKLGVDTLVQARSSTTGHDARHDATVHNPCPSSECHVLHEDITVLVLGVGSLESGSVGF